MSSILIVDDSADSRDFCEMMAQMFSADVSKARNVDEALNVLSQGEVPDYILLDLVMPGRRPEELVQRVKNDTRLSRTKVIVMSSLRTVKDITRKIGADDCLRKPFTLPRFIKTLHLQTAG